MLNKKKKRRTDYLTKKSGTNIGKKMALIKGYKKMKLSQQQENLLKYVPSVEVRAKIRSYMKNLIKDIKKAEDLMNEFGFKKRFLREKRIKQNELESIVWKLMINRNKRKRLLD